MTAGITVASGNWILPFDADDVYDRSFLGKAVEAVRKDPTLNLIYSDVESFGASTEIWSPDEYSFAALADHNVIPGPSLYRKEFWWRTGGYERALPWGAEDYNFWLGCGALGLRPHRVAGTLFEYRKHVYESMLAKMMKRWRTVEAMVRTIHALLHPDELILASQQIIAEMDEETFEELGQKDRRFGDLSWTFLWRGFKFVRDGRLDEAIEQFTQFERRLFRLDWQPIWGKLMCYIRLGHTAAAAECVDALRSWHYPLPFIQSALTHFSSTPSDVKSPPQSTMKVEVGHAL